MGIARICGQFWTHPKRIQLERVTAGKWAKRPSAGSMSAGEGCARILAWLDSLNDSMGTIHDADLMADVAGWPGDSADLMAALIEARLVVVRDGAHQWHDFSALNGSAIRQRNYRRNTSRNGSHNAPRNEPDNEIRGSGSGSGSGEGSGDSDSRRGGAGAPRSGNHQALMHELKTGYEEVMGSRTPWKNLGRWGPKIRAFLERRPDVTPDDFGQRFRAFLKIAKERRIAVQPAPFFDRYDTLGVRQGETVGDWTPPEDHA